MAVWCRVAERKKWLLHIFSYCQLWYFTGLKQHHFRKAPKKDKKKLKFASKVINFKAYLVANVPAIIYRYSVKTIFKWLTPDSFCLFSFFSTTILQKNCRLQRESNSDRRSKRRASWPLDHHHGPIKRNILHYPSFLMVSVCHLVFLHTSFHSLAAQKLHHWSIGEPGVFFDISPPPHWML